MRSSSERFGRNLLPLTCAAALCACSTGYDAWDDGGLASAPSAPTIPYAPSNPSRAPLPTAPAPNGPAADYPVVVGNPYSVQGATFTPEDKLNYDEVGYAVLDLQGGNTISGEHHTLPLPSYVEVTSLDTGKTILVRLERRGPMSSTNLVGLSQGAFAQLGANPGTPVRVRRVNPPEQERALLRAGAEAPARIDTPMSLVNVLRRKLPGGAEAAGIQASSPVTTPERIASPQDAAASSTPALPPLQPLGTSGPTRQAVTANIGTPGQRDFPWVATAPQPQASQPVQAPPSYSPAPSYTPSQPAPAPAAPSAGFVVQAGAFSSRQNAIAVARAINGSIDFSGTLYRVRTGPFASQEAAEASLAKVRAAGYSDARIYWSG